MLKYLKILIPLLLVLTACAQTQEEEKISKQIVEDYYAALNTKDYEKMYSLISEGFKKIEPTAKDYDTFEAAISKFYDTANGITLERTTVKSASKTKVSVDYVATILLKDGKGKELKSTFTVKKKPEGWRLIHPYGENIDNT